MEFLLMLISSWILVWLMTRKPYKSNKDKPISREELERIFKASYEADRKAHEWVQSLK